MIRDQTPGQARSPDVGNNKPQALEKFVPVDIILEDFLPFDAPDNDMVKCAGGIDS